jgi:hypothetical protein
MEIAMRRGALPGILGLIICLLAACVALIAFARQTSVGGGGFVVAFALAVEAWQAIALFALHGKIGAWLLAALAGELVALEIARIWLLRSARPAPPPAPRPYALPARVAVALQAAARARR